MIKMSRNKIKYGIKNAHVAKIISGDASGYTYGTPFACPGAISVSLNNSMSTAEIAADDINDYASQSVNNGYEGTLEVVNLPEEFATQILGDSNGVENSDTKMSEFALLFEFDGDQKKGRRCLWRCALTQRPSITHNTKSSNFTIDSDTINIKAMPRLDTMDVKGSCFEDWDVYANFFNAVPAPSDFVAPDAPGYYSVTQTLSHVTSSFTGSQAASGSAFTATLTEQIGHTIGTVTVTMGGADVTSTAYDDETGVITIAEVTGAIVITASATADT